MNPLAETLRTLAAALDRAEIRYVVGGSMASSAWGVLRATYDVDLVAAIAATRIEQLIGELGPEWYADPVQIREAIAGRRAFNLIHIPLGNKVDIFPATNDFHRRQLERAVDLVLPSMESAGEFPVATAEDILLAKLQWYRMGGEVSERQWNDILGILAANSDLDFAYARPWAVRLAVEDLLNKALEESRR
jgi:hypothetical protein